MVHAEEMKRWRDKRKPMDGEKFSRHLEEGILQDEWWRAATWDVVHSR